MTTAAVLTPEDVQSKLADTPGWVIAENALQRGYKFKDFVESVTFVMKVAFNAVAAEHHPEILICADRVTLTLSTHEAGGITEKDFELAKQINAIVSPAPVAE